jgi:hypothetical protein
MASAQERPWQLRRDLEKTIRTLAGRVEKLEASAAKPEAPKSRLARFVAWMGPALPTLIGSIVLLILGYMVKDSVDQSIRRQQLQMSFAKDAQEQLKAMGTRETAITQVEQAAVLVATFGPSAVLPLVNELRHGGNRAIGAQAGLEVVAIMEPETVCPILRRLLSNPSKLFSSEGHRAIARVLAVGGCRDAIPLLRQHERLVAAAAEGKADGVEGLKALVNNIPDAEQLETWRRALRDSLEVLARAGKEQ